MIPDETGLSHHGVLGMRWGVRKESSGSSQAQELAKLRRKQNNINSEAMMRGYELRGWQAGKTAKKELRRNPDAFKKSPSDAEWEAAARKAGRQASRKVLALGVAQTAALLVGGNMLINRMNAKPETALGAKFAVVALGAQMSRITISELHAIHVANKADDLRAQIKALETNERG